MLSHVPSSAVLFLFGSISAGPSMDMMTDNSPSKRYNAAILLPGHAHRADRCEHGLLTAPDVGRSGILVRSICRMLQDIMNM
jgi:hypothetical protein